MPFFWQYFCTAIISSDPWCTSLPLPCSCKQLQRPLLLQIAYFSISLLCEAGPEQLLLITTRSLTESPWNTIYSLVLICLSHKVSGPALNFQTSLPLHHMAHWALCQPTWQAMFVWALLYGVGVPGTALGTSSNHAHWEAGKCPHSYYCVKLF